MVDFPSQNSLSRANIRGVKNEKSQDLSFLFGCLCGFPGSLHWHRGHHAEYHHPEPESLKGVHHQSEQHDTLTATVTAGATGT